jgi:FAD-dependent fumarate reductase
VSYSSWRLDTKVTKVLKGDGGVYGVEYVVTGPTGKDGRVVHGRMKKLLNGPVIFATGGFAGDAHGMLATYRPDLAGIPSTNDPRSGTQALLTAVGAQLVDMEQVQVHPTSFIDSADLASPVKFLAAEMLRGEGAVLLFEGKRFCNEMDTRNNVTTEIMKLPQMKVETEGGTKTKQWDIQLILDEGVYANTFSHIDFYLFKKLMQKVPLSSLHPDTISTLQAYSQTVSATKSNPDAFSRSSFGNWTLDASQITRETEVYVGTVTPAIHFTMGGVQINENSEVLTEDGKGIGGLWAAGEVTGGVHGENRLGGSSLLECVVFGRRAGEGVARYLEGKK